MTLPLLATTTDRALWGQSCSRHRSSRPARRSLSISPSSTGVRRRQEAMPPSPAAVPAGFFGEQSAAPSTLFQTQHVGGDSHQNRQTPPVFGATCSTRWTSPATQPPTPNMPVAECKAESSPARTPQNQNSIAQSSIIFGSGTGATLAAQLPTTATMPLFGSSAGETPNAQDDTLTPSSGFVFRSTTQTVRTNQCSAPAAPAALVFGAGVSPAPQNPIRTDPLVNPGNSAELDLRVNATSVSGNHAASVDTTSARRKSASAPVNPVVSSTTCANQPTIQVLQGTGPFANTDATEPAARLDDTGNAVSNAASTPNAAPISSTSLATSGSSTSPPSNPSTSSSILVPTPIPRPSIGQSEQPTRPSGSEQLPRTIVAEPSSSMVNGPGISTTANSDTNAASTTDASLITDVNSIAATAGPSRSPLSNAATTVARGTVGRETSTISASSYPPAPSADSLTIPQAGATFSLKPSPTISLPPPLFGSEDRQQSQVDRDESQPASSRSTGAAGNGTGSSADTASARSFNTVLTSMETDMSRMAIGNASVPSNNPVFSPSAPTSSRRNSIGNSNTTAASKSAHPPKPQAQGSPASSSGLFRCETSTAPTANAAKSSPVAAFAFGGCAALSGDSVGDSRKPAAVATVGVDKRGESETMPGNCEDTQKPAARGSHGADGSATLGNSEASRKSATALQGGSRNSHAVNVAAAFANSEVTSSRCYKNPDENPPPPVPILLDQPADPSKAKFVEDLNIWIEDSRWKMARHNAEVKLWKQREQECADAYSDVLKGQIRETKRVSTESIKATYRSTESWSQATQYMIDEAKQFLAGEGRQLLGKPPNEFCCPITLEVMSNPVVATDGNTYEETAIRDHFRYSGNQRRNTATSPLTNKSISMNLIPNYSLRSMILRWKVENTTPSVARVKAD